ncbi:hypothetical protein HN446_04840 [bacterium]|jgi:hypothetical protein|nr:hypothetical protein [bacterium]
MFLKLQSNLFFKLGLGFGSMGMRVSWLKQILIFCVFSTYIFYSDAAESVGVGCLAWCGVVACSIGCRLWTKSCMENKRQRELKKVFVDTSLSIVPIKIIEFIVQPKCEKTHMEDAIVLTRRRSFP